MFRSLFRNDKWSKCLLSFSCKAFDSERLCADPVDDLPSDFFDWLAFSLKCYQFSILFGTPDQVTGRRSGFHAVFVQTTTLRLTYNQPQTAIF